MTRGAISAHHGPILRALKDGCLTSAAVCCTLLHMDKTLSPPTKPPRVSVPLTQEVLEVFQRLAKAGNMSTGGAIAEWLGDTVEAAEFMASKMEQARAAPKVVMREMHAYALGLADETGQLMRDLAAKGTADRAGAARDAQAPSRGRAGGRISIIPPSGNTGGKGQENHSKVSSTHKVKTHKTPENGKRA